MTKLCGNILFCFFLTSCLLFETATSCGPITHIEISYRALDNYKDFHEDTDYSQIASSHQDALEAGSVFPDVFYPPTCFFGQFSDVSEDTHWTPFLNASITYINTKYPKPWSQSTQKLISFLLGVVSHQVSDVLWHSLGINQGFLQTMSKMNFHDVYTDAHPVGDAGGDILNVHQLNLDYSSLLGDWYVPVEDLANIYEELYGNTHVNPFVISVCSRMVFLYKFAARLGAGAFFPEYAKQSPFLVDHLYNYFQGGIDDMSAWTRRIWRQYTQALQNDLEGCSLPYNSLFIRCNNTSPALKDGSKESKLKNGFYTQMDLGGLNLEDVIVEKAERGIFLKAGQKMKEMIMSQGKTHSLRFESEDLVRTKTSDTEDVSATTPVLPDKILTSKKAYAQLGSAFAVGDLNGDGYDDLAVGSAGVYPAGVVYLLYGSNEGINSSHQDIEEVAAVSISMPEDEHSSNSLFGAALATFDFDLDGQLDLAVGAPSYKSVDLLYQGRVFIFSVNISSPSQVYLRATVDCLERFCNLGYSLAADKSTEIGLIIGSPFAEVSGEEQIGIISFLAPNAQYAGSTNLKFTVQMFTGQESVSVDDLTIVNIKGTMSYSWTGYSVGSMEVNSVPHVIFGEPGLRKCANSSCDYSPDDKQTAGQVKRGQFIGGVFTQSGELDSTSQFAEMGTQTAHGITLTSFPDYVAVSSPSHTVSGKIIFEDYTFEQGGMIVLLKDFVISGFIKGNREYSRFGNLVQFADLNNDNRDELIVGAPLWTRFPALGVQEGRVYVYGGGEFPDITDVSGDCGDSFLISPCPSKRAYKVLSFGEDLARFGTQAAALKSSFKTSLFVTAAHSSRSGRLAGAIGIFDFMH
ncbi:phosphatidylinositol-glycan-specific phospholipase d [Plakobranchus ocellatus]|uniref:Phosphatidylinositol-glycan-specific phospholipase D n=1 Tax=Plakobranchus ocellatus TaxID=259542 RepID=A0AAV3ZH93_9GAST|nr:phosphatidylinositol-glycan-specific phospholipase d [Plakobranchus ocellatus]